MVVFGEYFSNFNRLPVSLWGFLSGNWVTLMVYPEGTIEHIHNICCINGYIIVQTGDFDSASNIFIYKENFSNLIRRFTADQKYRSVWMYELDAKIYYATDTQFEANYLITIPSESLIDNKADVNRCSEINGSSIYSCFFNDTIFFSTTVEPGLPRGSFLKDVFDDKIGPGIKSKESYIYAVDKTGNVLVILSARKDIFPMRLFQFGAFKFPYYCLSNKNDPLLYVYSNALTYSSSTLIFEGDLQ